MAEKKTPAKQAAAKPAPKPAPKAAEKPAENVVALVPDQPDQPAEPKKKRGRQPGSVVGAKRGRKGGPEVVFMIETEEGSGLYERREALPSTELMDLMDAHRKVVAVRKWREFE